MRFDMMPHIVSTPGWLPNPPARDVGRLLLCLPDTPDVIKLRCFALEPYTLWILSTRRKQHM
jgi:hypothetical protein